MPFTVASPSIAAALAARGYTDPTPVQAAVLEHDGSGADLLVSAQTGSGKTVAFGLAIASSLLGEAELLGEAGRPLALIIAPTRELALQVHRELTWLYEKAGAQVASCVGGMDQRTERRALARGAHIVVGTPGRLRDHMERGALDVSALQIVVLDEADEMLDLGFREDLEFLLDAMPVERRTLLFSATIPGQIAALARRFQRDAVRIDTVVRNQPHADIEYQAVRIAPNDVEHAVVNLLRFHDLGAALVFCATREAVNHLHANLAERGFTAVALSGEFTQNERNHALQALRDGRAKVCVATDVAARGLDLPDLGLVIHSDLPRNRETLLHRSGRTGRAGKKGLCVLLVPHTRRRVAERLSQSARIEAKWTTPPTQEQIRKQDETRLLQHPIFEAERTEEDTALGQALLAGRSPEDIAVALARLFREQLPAPEDLLDVGPQDRPRPERSAHRDQPRSERGEQGSDHPRDRPPRVPMQWFKINAGRNMQADPRWLIPLICRLGHITKREIGAIRVGDRETRFEISVEASRHFMSAVEQAADPEVRIAPSDAPPQQGARGDREGPRPKADHAKGKGPKDGKPPFKKGRPPKHMRKKGG
ncbi:MAG: DEAD/DEAH box helicase [Alphaproteobacteria bacterium]|nr:DEAD/DEAH box helicase [Alphaproteobacteria bacterium]